MTWCCRLCFLWTLLCCCGDALRAQVVHLSGSSSTLAESHGASLNVLTADSASAVSLGYADGLRLGWTRSVDAGPLHMTAGNAPVSVSLLTDMPGTQRVIPATGYLLQAGGTALSGSFYAGRPGAVYGGAGFSTVESSGHLLLARGRAEHGRGILEGLLLDSHSTAALGSAAFRLQPETLAAITAGWSSGRPYLQLLLLRQTPQFTLQLSQTEGRLDVPLPGRYGSSGAERNGFNAVVSRRFGGHVWVDAGRYRYRSVGAGVQPDASTLLEGGATVRLGHLQTGMRLLQSTSSSVHTNAWVGIAGWSAQRWNVTGIVLHRRAPGQDGSDSVEVETEERIRRHLRLQQGLSLGSGTPQADVGGTLEGNWGSVRIAHSEVYLPFGTVRGFRRALSAGVTLHMRDAEVSVTRTSITGLRPQFDAAADDYFGTELGTSAPGLRPSRSLPAYLLRGIVLDGGRPVRGAAVSVGDEVVYTGADGRWLARFRRPSTVRVALQPTEFVSAAAYRALSPAMLLAPQRQPELAATPIVLRVVRDTAPPPADATTTDLRQSRTATAASTSMRRQLASLGLRLLQFWKVRPSDRS